MTLPTQLTVLRIVLAPVFFLLFAVLEPTQIGWAMAVFVVAALSDWYDGHFARKLNLVTPFGAFLDPLADKILTSAAFFAFAARGLVPWWMVLVVIARDIYLTGFRMLADSLGTGVRTSFFAKMKTFTQMVFIGSVLIGIAASKESWGVITTLGKFWVQPEVLYWTMLVVMALTAISAAEYTYENWQVLRAIFKRLFSRRSPQEL